MWCFESKTRLMKGNHGEITVRRHRNFQTIRVNLIVNCIGSLFSAAGINLELALATKN